MRKIFTASTTSAINVAMTVEPKCYDDRYNAEVQFAELKVWNEKDRLFCSVSIEMIVVDSEDSRNNAVIEIDENKVALPSLSKQIKYTHDDHYVIIDLITTTSDRHRDLMYEAIDRWLEIDVRIEGI